MKVSDKGLDLITSFEGIKLTAYKCSAGVWTLGIGSTFYADGTPVKEGDTCTLQEAHELFKLTLVNFENCVLRGLGKTKVNQNQFDALVSLAYNIGCGNFRKSSVLRFVSLNPNDPAIETAFLMWNKIGGKVSNGLQRRRDAEKTLYFSND